MTTKLLIGCPVCHQQHEIFLKRKVHAVILPCSDCGSMISYSAGRSRLVKESLLKKIDDMKTVEDLKMIMGIINAHVELDYECHADNDVIDEDDIISIRNSLDRGDFWAKYMDPA